MRRAKTMLVYQAVAHTLKNSGIDTVFGLMGDGNMRIVTSLAQDCGIQYYAARHEGGALSMADAYARITGKVGICTVTQGPGVTNTMNSLVEAVKARTPLLLLAGATPTTVRGHNQQIDQSAMVASIGAGYEPFRGIETLTADLTRALRRAMLESRPILFSLPTNYQDLEVEPPTQIIQPVEAAQPVYPAPTLIKKMADLIESARRPVILGGQGAVRAGARRSLEELGERIGALFATSAVAKGLFAGNDFSVGVAGGFSTRLTAQLIGQADLIVAFGASLNEWTTRHGTLFAPSARIIHCDLNPMAPGFYTPVTLGVTGDAAATAQALLGELAARGFQQEGFHTEAVKREIADYRPEDEFEDEGIEGRVDPRSLILRLKKLLPYGYTLTIDGGHCTGFPIAYLDVPDAAGYVFPIASQTLGIGVGCAIGAAVARPDRFVALVTGDGALMMGLADIDTAVRYHLPVLIIVVNDAAYGAEIYFLEKMGLTSRYARFQDPDIVAIARGIGARGLTVRKLDELDQIQPWLAQPDGPFVVDCKVNPEVRGEWFKIAFGDTSKH
jgi:thiamine pyrophosphate-dependent acetolactate synthase large subunit-like protein